MPDTEPPPTPPTPSPAISSDAAPLTGGQHHPSGRGKGAPSQAVFTAAVGATAFLAGSFLYFALLAGPGTMSLEGITALITSPQLLVWTLAVVTVGLIGRRLGPRAVAVWALALAPASTFAGILIAYPRTLDQPQALVSPIFLIPFVWQASGLFGAAVAGVLAGVALRLRSADRFSARAVASGVAVVLLVVGGVAALALPAHWASVYFRIWSDPVLATPEQGDRYVAIATTAVGCLLIAVVAAIFARRRAVIWLTTIAFTLALLAALVFQVPEGRFAPQPAPADGGRPHHPVCYGTSGDCPGG
ncbi:hypothetical protein JNB63_04410 [Microbacterium trichothecenolyticum]|uniref:Uncharacterized protein n=1 Tax=Microbacterium ureisolvens TaxID=2781186 RepID=A0ABS7HZK5_9MICO|nr:MULTISPECIES: hypothetical protein [Microbacterium]MBW9110030.1 hypothetical protein [Microbacterium ureisolvens]MBW9119327.1 hypothetical protein [Microbacterium trichothecenolyticum]